MQAGSLSTWLPGQGLAQCLTIVQPGLAEQAFAACTPGAVGHKRQSQNIMQLLQHSHYGTIPVSDGLLSPTSCSTTAPVPAGAAVVKRKVTASGVRARITASRTIFDFGKSIVIRANQMKPPYALEVTFTSNEAEPVQWQFGHASTEGQEGCKGVFAAEPKSGSLLKVEPVGACGMRAASRPAVQVVGSICHVLNALLMSSNLGLSKHIAAAATSICSPQVHGGWLCCQAEPYQAPDNADKCRGRLAQ